MKMKKNILSAVSAVAAAAAFTTVSGAYVSIPASGNSGLVATNQNWKLVINGSYNVDYTKVGSLQFVTKVTDINAYEKDKAAGVYGDTEKAFAEFSGCVALGANDWFQYDYSSIGAASGDSASAGVSPSSDGTVVFTANLTGQNVTNEAQAWTAISFSEWGNSSADYSVTVISATLYDKSGNLIISFDGNGNCIATAPAETSAPETTPETTTTTTAPETTTTTTTTTTAATTPATTTTEATTVTTTEEVTTEETTTEETSEETSEETEEAAEETEETAEEAEEAAATEEATTTAAAVTTAATEAETTTTAAETTKEAVQAVAAQPSSMTSMSDSLMIVLIAAGVVIVGAIIGFIIVAAKRKK